MSNAINIALTFLIFGIPNAMNIVVHTCTRRLAKESQVLCHFGFEGVFLGAGPQGVPTRREHSGNFHRGGGGGCSLETLDASWPEAEATLYFRYHNLIAWERALGTVQIWTGPGNQDAESPDGHRFNNSGVQLGPGSRKGSRGRGASRLQEGCAEASSPKAKARIRNAVLRPGHRAHVISRVSNSCAEDFTKAQKRVRERVRGREWREERG